MKIKVLELFAGIGACSKALKNIGIDVEIADVVDIDKYAIESFNAIHNTNFEPQDIAKWNKDIEVDLITHGSPCQDFSLAGKQAGGDKDSGTRSSLMYETIRIVEKLKPKYVLWENVKNLLSKKHRHNFDAYIEIMNNLGYISYYQVLNAKDYGIPQNRERVYTISIRKDLDKGYIFPQKEKLELKLKDLLENNVDEKYYLSKEKIDCISATERINQNKNDNVKEIGYIEKGTGQHQSNTVYDINGLCPTICSAEAYKSPYKFLVKNATKKGYIEAIDGDSVNLQFPNSATRRGRVGKQISQTIQTADNMGVIENLKIRKLTPLECWRLMGFDDEDFYKAQAVPTSNTQLYKQAGNSIVVKVLEKIFKNLFKEGVKKKYISKD